MRLLEFVLSLWIGAFAINGIFGCQFYPAGEYLRFVRIPENLPLAAEVIQIEVHPRRNLSLQPVDKPEDVEYFKFRPVNRSSVSVRLAKPLNELVDGPNPQSVLKFRMVCEYEEGDETISSYLAVSVYVEDVNDNAPVFVNAPYLAKVDETVSPGSTIFHNILAIDRDKPNTPNSDVHYSIIGGNEKGKFSLEDSNPSAILLRTPIDYDTGDKNFLLTLLATDRGNPQQNATTTLAIAIVDNDDLSPKFTSELYKAQIPEFFHATDAKIHHELKFSPPIHADDQDRGINTPIRYDIVAGNDHNIFAIDSKNGTMFLERQLDLEALPGNLFTLQIQASQLNNPLKFGTARCEIELLDINDNLPKFETEVYNISIVENLPAGFNVLQVEATDLDQGENGEFTYQLIDPSQTFNIDSKTGWLSVKNQAQLDREKIEAISLRVYAREKYPSVVKHDYEKEPSVQVEINLLDANDNNPTFVPSNMYEFNITTDVPIGQKIGKVNAIDLDQGKNGEVIYSIQRNSNLSTSEEYFKVDGRSGDIILINKPSTLGRRILFLEATDQPAISTERRYALAVVTINIMPPEDPDFIPEFIGAPYEFWVGSDVEIHTSVGQIRVHAIEKDKFLYDLLHTYPEGVPFAVEETTGTISVVDRMSKYDKSLYNFEAVATDKKAITLNTNVTIHVVEPDSNNILSKNTDPVGVSFRVRENQSGAFVGQLLKPTSASRQAPKEARKSNRFIIVNQPDVQNKFAISQDGTIYTQQSLDRETQSAYQLTVFVESGKGVVKNWYHVNITVEDENDNAPKFERNQYEGFIFENSMAKTEVQLDYPIRATDYDIGQNAMFTISLAGNGSELFFIDQNSGRVYLKLSNSLDREYVDRYELTLIVKDKGDLSAEARLSINIRDINDHNPKFVQMVVHHKEGAELIQPNNNIKNNKNKTTENNVNKIPTVAIPESLIIGTSIVRLRAIDEDEGENSIISYKIISETYIPDNTENKLIKTYLTPHFNVHPFSGEITVANTLPPETDFQLNISAVDKGDLEGFTILKIRVKDVNNNAPVFGKAWYDFSVPEGSYNNHVLGQILATDEDRGYNGNISYSILLKREPLSEFPFRISSVDGTFSIHGDLDRETREFYTFRVKAEDMSVTESRLHSTVDVDVRVSDLNDNYPIFFNYDKTIKANNLYEDDKLLMLDEKRSPRKKDLQVPVYFASVLENSGSGVPIARIFANDTDLPANGNGLVLFHIPRKRNQRELFTIDSKEGVVTTLTSLDFEDESSYNITVLASDLGKPSLTSTALVVVNVIDIQEASEEVSTPIFAHRYYEMEVEENCAVPLSLLALNVSSDYNSNRSGNIIFGIIPDEHSEYFKVNPHNGSIYLIKSPDRELTPKLSARIRVDRLSKRGKSLQMIYPLQSSTDELAPNEVKLIVHVTDENDNSPKFSTNSLPIIASIPNTVSYGYPVIQIQATDEDAGLNADIRYSMMRRSEEDKNAKFAIDTVSGHVRTATNFIFDTGHVFGFDIKATDRAGAHDGRSTIINAFVFVIDEQSKVVMKINGRPNEVEENIKNITEVLSSLSGFNVRVYKMEPQLDREEQNIIGTSLHLYAVDSLMNSVIDNTILSQNLKEKENEIKVALEPLKVLTIAAVKGENELRSHRTEKTFLSGLEVMTVILGCVIILGALTAAVCVSCFNRKRKHKDHGSNLFPTIDNAEMPFSMYTGTKSVTQLSSCQPRSLFNPLSFVEDSTDSYSDGECLQRQPRRSSFHLQHPPPSCDHNNNRASKRFQKPLTRSPSSRMLAASVASLHSSSRDSGIDPHRRRSSVRCSCRKTMNFSSEQSSNGSYEDSLQSFQPLQSQSSSEDGVPFSRRFHTRSSRRQDN